MTRHPSTIPTSACLFLATAVLLCAGCQSEYRSDARKLDGMWTNGDYAQAATLAWKDAKEEARHRKNRVVYFLEAGRTAQAAGDYRTSSQAFDAAFVDTFPYLDESPEATVSEALVTTVGNDTMSRYRGTPNDRIMLHALNALNFMAMGRMQDARIELNRSQLWQDDAHHRYAKAIELAHSKSRKNVNAASEEWSSDSGGAGWAAQSGGVMHRNTRQIIDGHYASLADKKGHAKYGNPFASHVRGVFRLATRAYDGDLAMARFELRDVAAMVPRRIPLLADDIEYASAAGQLEPTTWIYFMTGQSPELTEEKIVMPLALSGSFTMPTLALPKMVFDETNPMQLQILSPGQGSVQTHLLADNAAIAAAQFKERLPIIITQEGVRATGKAIASYVAMRFSQQQQSLAASLLALGTVVYQVGSAQADLRTWHTLPAEIQMARIPTPSSGEIQLGTAAGRDLGTARVTPGECNILVVSMPSAASAMPSLMPIQLTGNIEPWTPSFDLQAVPDDERVPDASGVVLAKAEQNDATNTPTAAPAADPDEANSGDAPHKTALAESIDGPEVVDALSVTDPPEAAKTQPQIDAPVDSGVHVAASAATASPHVDVTAPPIIAATPAEDAEVVVAVALEPIIDDELEPADVPDSVRVATAVPAQPSMPTPEHVEAPELANVPALADVPELAGVPELATTPKQATTPKAAPIAMHLSARTMRLRWGQPMDWSPPLDDVLDTRIRLSFDRNGYTQATPNATTIMTSPRSLFLRRTARMHRSAIHAIGAAMQETLLGRGLLGARVHAGTSKPDSKGEVELFYLVTLPLDGSTAQPHWPAHVRPIPAMKSPVAAFPTLVETSKEHHK